MATVWAARLRGSRGFEKIVALKTISPRLCSDARYERMFLDEATFAGQIRHPNVAQILDLGEDNGVLFLAMEWIDGVTIDDLLREVHSGRIEIPLPVAIRIATQVAAGLHAAHELRDADGELVGLVHGDVSPQNIVVSFDGVTKLVDFGLAKLTSSANGIPEHSDVRGKLAYLAPEQVRGRAVDRRADLFALGVVLYMLATGRHPFATHLHTPGFDAGGRGRARAPSEFIEDFPAELEATLLRCLERAPSQRFATSDELVWALESSLPSEFRATDQDVAVLVRCLAADAEARRGRPVQLVATRSRPPARPSLRAFRTATSTSPDSNRTTRRLVDAAALVAMDARALSRPLVLCAAFLGSVAVLAVGSALRSATHHHPLAACADCALSAPHVGSDDDLDLSAENAIALREPSTTKDDAKTSRRSHGHRLRQAGGAAPDPMAGSHRGGKRR